MLLSEFGQACYFGALDAVKAVRDTQRCLDFTNS